MGPYTFDNNELDKIKKIKSRNACLVAENEKLKNENASLIQKYKSDMISKSDYDQLKHEFDLLNSSKKRVEENNTMLSKKIESLSASLGKLTSGTRALDSILESQRSLSDKTGIGFNKIHASTSIRQHVQPNNRRSNARESQPRAEYNSKHLRMYRVDHRPHNHHYITHSKHKELFQYTSTYFNHACIHCSLHSHTSLNCPNRFRIDNRRYKWVVKTQTSNSRGPKLI